MSIERQITKELDGVLAYIRRAEANIIGMDSADKLEVVQKLVDLEKSIKDIKGKIVIPSLEITKDTLISDLYDEDVISVRACNCLRRAGCNTIGDITEHTGEEIAKMRNMGKKAYDEVLELLKKNGFEPKPEG